jgi:hypothetical protein
LRGGWRSSGSRPKGRAQGCARVFRQARDGLPKNPDDLQLPAKRAPTLPATPPPHHSGKSTQPRVDYLLSDHPHEERTPELGDLL